MPMTRQQQKWLAKILIENGGGKSVPAALGGKYAGGPSNGNSTYRSVDDEPDMGADGVDRPIPAKAPPAKPHHGGGSQPAHGAANGGAAKHAGHAGARPHAGPAQGAPPQHPPPQRGEPGPSPTKPGAAGGASGPLGIGLPTIVKAVEEVVQGAIKTLQAAGIGKPLVQPDLAGVAGKVIHGIIDAARKKAEESGVDPASLEKHAKELLAGAEKRIAEGAKTIKGIIDKVEKANKDLEAGKQKIADDAKKTIDAVKTAVKQGGEKILDDAVDVVRTVAKDVGLEQQEKQLEAAATAVKQGAEKAVSTAGKVVQDIGAAERKIAGDVADTVRSVEKAVEQGVTKTLGDAEAAAKGVIADIFG